MSNRFSAIIIPLGILILNSHSAYLYGDIIALSRSVTVPYRSLMFIIQSELFVMCVVHRQSRIHLYEDAGNDVMELSARLGTAS